MRHEAQELAGVYLFSTERVIMDDFQNVSFRIKKPTPDDKLLTEAEASEILGVKPTTLQIWRCTKRYPLPYIKVGRLVRYRQSAIDAFLASRTHE